MSRQKAKGTSFEGMVARYLSRVTGSDVHRAAQGGAKDTGDLKGFTVRGKRTVLECKNCSTLKLSQWIDETEAERGNDDAEYGVLVMKRPGFGEANIGYSYAVMTLETLAAISVGGWEHMEEE